MKKLLWRIVFTLIVIDCLNYWFSPSSIKMVWRESRQRYRAWNNASDEAYNFLKDMYK